MTFYCDVPASTQLREEFEIDHSSPLSIQVAYVRDQCTAITHAVVGGIQVLNRFITEKFVIQQILLYLAIMARKRHLIGFLWLLVTEGSVPTIQASSFSNLKHLSTRLDLVAKVSCIKHVIVRIRVLGQQSLATL